MGQLLGEEPGEFDDQLQAPPRIERFSELAQRLLFRAVVPAGDVVPAPAGLRRRGVRRAVVPLPLLDVDVGPTPVGAAVTTSVLLAVQLARVHVVDLNANADLLPVVDD